jgi:ABC-type transporter Mla subunit MlaD
MSESNEIGNRQAERATDEVAGLLADLSNRIGDTVESIAELADDVDERRSEIKLLLDDLRALQSKIAHPKRNRLGSLIDRLEGIYRELEAAGWTMDCATEGLPEEIDLLEILEQPIDGFD